MIAAKCDVCGKDLGEVPLEVILDDSGMTRIAVSTDRKFKLRAHTLNIEPPKVACSVDCAAKIDGPEPALGQDISME